MGYQGTAHHGPPRLGMPTGGRYYPPAPMNSGTHNHQYAFQNTEQTHHDSQHPPGYLREMSGQPMPSPILPPHILHHGRMGMPDVHARYQQFDLGNSPTVDRRSGSAVVPITPYSAHSPTSEIGYSSGASSRKRAASVMGDGEDPFQLEHGDRSLQERLSAGRKDVWRRSATWEAELFEGPIDDYAEVMKGLFQKILLAHLDISDLRIMLGERDATMKNLENEMANLKETFDAGIAKAKGKKTKNIANEHPDLKVRVNVYSIQKKTN
jgi:hypothetical protein